MKMWGRELIFSSNPTAYNQRQVEKNLVLRYNYMLSETTFCYQKILLHMNTCYDKMQ